MNGRFFSSRGATEVIMASNCPPDARSNAVESQPPLLTWRFALLLTVQLSYGFVFSAFLLLPKYLATVHHADADVIGQLSGAALFASVAVVPLLSWLLARVSRGALIVSGALLGGGASVAFAWCDTVPEMLALRLLQGVAFVLVFNANGTLVTDLVPRERLGQALGLWGLAMLVTNAIAPALLEPVADQYGWVPVFYVAGAAGLIAAVMGGVIATQERGAQPTPSEPSAPVFDARRLLVFGVTALVGTGLGTMFTFVQPFALELGIHHISGFFAGYTLAAIGSRVGFGGLADRWGRAPVSAAGLVLYGTTVVLTAWLSPMLLFVVGAGIGLAHGICYPAMNALAVENTTPTQRGPVMAYYNGAFNVGFAISVTLFGEVAKGAGYPTVFLMAGALVLTGAVGLFVASVRGLQNQRRAPPCSVGKEKPCSSSASHS